MIFRVGQKVVCVNAGVIPGREADTSCGWARGEQIVEGSVYTVRSVHTDDYGHPVLWLDEVSRHPHARRAYGASIGYHQDRFRPAVDKKTDISIFKAMLNPTREGVPA